MKKIIDKQSGRIISILNVDEAKKVLKMYINYCLGKQEVKKSRLNLVKYLGDFINYSDKKDIAKFYDILVKEKDGFEFSKSDAKAYDSLISFFELYSNIEKGTFEVNNVSSYITTAMEKKASIENKVENGEELNFEEKLNDIFFNKGFDLSVLAKHACQKYEEMLKEKIEQTDGGIDVSLQEELAYQDLVDLCSMSEKDIKASAETSELIVETSGEGVGKANDQNIGNDFKELEENTTIQYEPEHEQEVVFEDEGNNKKDDSENEGDKQEEIPVTESDSDTDEQEVQEQDDNNENETIIQPEDVSDATKDVGLRDAADFFSGALDGFADMKKNENNNDDDNDNDNGDSFGGTLRDR